MEIINSLPHYFPHLYLAGQFCEIFGAFLLFKYSLPPSLNRLRGAITFNDTDKLTEEQEKDEKKSTTLYKRGFLLILIGFFLQLPSCISNVF